MQYQPSERRGRSVRYQQTAGYQEPEPQQAPYQPYQQTPYQQSNPAIFTRETGGTAPISAATQPLGYAPQHRQPPQPPMHQQPPTHQREWFRWLLFVVLIALFAVGAWIGWSLLNGKPLLPSIDQASSSSAITIGVRGGADSLDLRTDPNPALDRVLLENVYDTLITRDENNTLQPRLATKWDVTPNGLQYTFTLRPNLTFSNGDPLDASAVVWSLQQGMHNHYVGYDEAAAHVVSVENPNPNTVIIKLNAPNPRLARQLAGRAGVVYNPRAHVTYANSALGSGPLRVIGFSNGSSITLQRNEHYWGTPAQTRQLTVRAFNDDASLLQALRAGEIQLAVPQDAASAQAFANDDAVHVAHGVSVQKVMLGYNADASSIFSDQQVRKAVRFSLNVNALARNDANAADALYGPISALEPGYENLAGAFPYNPQHSQSLLAYFSAGYLGEITLLAPQRYEPLANAVVKQLQQNTKFRVKSSIVDEANYQNALQADKFTLAIMDVPGTDNLLPYIGAQSPLHYQNGNAQRTYEDALKAPSANAYEERIRNCARQLSDDAASAWLFSKKTTVVARANVAGYPHNLIDERLPLDSLALK